MFESALDEYDVVLSKILIDAEFDLCGSHRSTLPSFAIAQDTFPRPREGSLVLASPVLTGLVNVLRPRKRDSRCSLHPPLRIPPPLHLANVDDLARMVGVVRGDVGNVGAPVVELHISRVFDYTI